MVTLMSQLLRAVSQVTARNCLSCNRPYGQGHRRLAIGSWHLGYRRSVSDT